MGLIDRVAQMFRRPAGAVATTSDELVRPSGGPLSLADVMLASSDRQATVRACREMYANDPRAEGVIRTLARDMVRGGCAVEVSGLHGDGTGASGGQAARAQEVADELLARLDLAQRLDDWIRLTLRDGDSFLELAVSGDLQIVDVSRKPTLEMRRYSSDRDRFEDPRRAFWQGDAWWVSAEPPRDAIWYAEWQMIHARWGNDEGNRYGRPLFASATTPYKRMREGETDIAVRRKTRAGLKYNHRFPEGTPEDVILRYKALNRDSLNNPTAAIADFFGSVDISVVQGDANLADIADVLHHIRTWWLASPVPMSLLGYGQDLNRDVLETQAEQYRRALEGLEAWPETEIVIPLLERQWLLAGIVPEGLEYKIRWLAKEPPLTATGVEQAANAAVKLAALGRQDVADQVLRVLLPGIEFAAREAPQADAAETTATPGRMALAADELRARMRWTASR